MIEILQQLDADFLLFLNGIHTPVTDSFMKAYTGRWIWVPFYCTLAWFVLRRMGWRNGFVTIAAIGLAVAISDQTCASLLRPFVERLRPTNPDNPLSAMVHIVDGYRGGSYGFPSCHAANSFALATYIGWISRRNYLWIIVLVWAIINCYTRLYLGVHYPGDILVGAAVGACAATAVYWLVRKVLHIKYIVGNFAIKPVLLVATLMAVGLMIWSIIR